LVSIAHLEGFYYKPRIDLETLQKYSEGLILTTSCIKGEIPSYLLEGNEEKAKRGYMSLKRYSKMIFILNIQNHNLKEELRSSSKLIKISNETKTKYIASMMFII